jgi:leucyl aminopeptidase
MSVKTGGVAVAAGFDPVPSAASMAAVTVTTSATVPDAVDAVDAVGWTVTSDGDVPAELGHDRAALARAGFEGKAGQALVLPQAAGPPLVAVGTGPADARTVDGLRDAAGTFARAAGDRPRLALVVPRLGGVEAAVAARAATEGVLLARYRYDALVTKAKAGALASLVLVGEEGLAGGIERGRVLAGACALARDLANCPPAHLTAVAMAEVATRLGAESGLGVEVFDEPALWELGCGGLLGVNAGSHDEPRMIKLTYEPKGERTGHLTLVGKGIMYDSGGISLKPADGTHATMKNDMSGAGAVLAAMTALSAIDCRTAVTGYLMCTDNMPSGTALKMGDIITMRGGTTVEVANTDAEGRLVMGDALVLATEEPTDAIVDIATLTGAALRALGPEIAAVIGNHDGVVDQIKAASAATDEPVWELPLARRYRKYLDTDIADLNNLGGSPHAGAITAALFLAELVGDHPWAHIDIAGTAQADKPDAWRTAGCTGFGARLLVELADAFTAPGR